MEIILAAVWLTALVLLIVFWRLNQKTLAEAKELNRKSEVMNAHSRELLEQAQKLFRG